MFKRIRKQNKESVGISLGRLAGSALKGVGAFFGFVAGLEKEGKSEYRQCGQVEGRIRSGKNIRGIYGFRVKVGLTPEEFRDQKKLSAKGGPASGGDSGSE